MSLILKKMQDYPTEPNLSENTETIGGIVVDVAGGMLAAILLSARMKSDLSHSERQDGFVNKTKEKNGSQIL